MAQIYNTELSKELKDGAKIQQLRDVIPSQLADKVVPVMEVNPKLLRRSTYSVSNSLAVSGSGTIVALGTVAPNKKFFITGVIINVIKDATCDTSTGAQNLTIVQDGATRNLLSFPFITLTAQQFSVNLSFSEPIAVDMNSSIGWASKTFTVGIMQRYCTFFGYFEENSLA